MRIRLSATMSVYGASILNQENYSLLLTFLRIVTQPYLYKILFNPTHSDLLLNGYCRPVLILAVSNFML